MDRDRQDVYKTVVLRSRIGTVLCWLMYTLVSSMVIEQNFAKDYGIVGHTYEIIEQDIIEYIKTRLALVDLKDLEEKTQEKVKASVMRPEPVSGITKAIKQKELYYDPTFVLEDAVRDHEGKIIHPKGTKINPLDKTSFSNVLIFIDGDDMTQVEYALQQYQSLNNKAKIILINGLPIELQRKNKIWIYFDQAGMLTTKLGIKHVPAIVTQEELKLKIIEVAL